MKKILIVVDMQNDFITGPLGNDDCKAVVEPIKKLIENESWDLIRFTADTHGGSENSEKRYQSTIEGKTLPIHCVPGSRGWKIVSELADKADSNDIEEKDTFGSFHLGANVQFKLEHIIWDTYTNRGEEYEFHLVGVCTSICVLSNAVILRSEFPCSKIIVHKDCTADVTPEKKEAALECLKSIFCEVV